MKSKKILIIVIIIIVILAITGTAIGYLYVATDTFKSDKELFAKYMSQNVEMLQEMTDLQAINVYKKLEDEEKYEMNTNVKMEYSEGGEISNPLNNLAAQLNVQKDDESRYFYADGQILFGEEEYLEAELIKEQELYGIRFSDVAKQFITIKNDQNLETVANDIGTDSFKLKTIMDIIDGTKQASEEIISQDEAKTLKEKYLNMLTEAISNGTFESNRKAMITYNNNTIKVKAYTVFLSSEQVENLIVQILNNLKTETAILRNVDDEELYTEKIEELIRELSEEKELPTIKMTVYEQQQNTIKTVVEIGLNKIIIENGEENGELKSKIQFSKMDSEKTNAYDIEVTKRSDENQEEVSLIANITEGEEIYTINFISKIQSIGEKVTVNTGISYKKDILTIAAVLENEINLGSDFEKKQTLSDSNNVVLNDIEEERRKSIINALKENVPVKVETRLGLLMEALGLQNDNTTGEEPVSDVEMTQVEKNKFNAKFEFYTGNEVSAENVKTLLEIVKDNLGSYEITPVENQEDGQETKPEDIKYSIKLNIERNKVDEEGINQVLEKIDDKKKYKVSIFYNEQNQLIDYITIDEVEK